MDAVASPPSRSERRCVKVVEAVGVVMGSRVPGYRFVGRRGAVWWWAKVARLGMARTACLGKRTWKRKINITMGKI